MHAQAHRKHPLPLQNQTGRVEVGKRIGFGAIMAKRTVAAKVFASGAVMCNKLLGAQSVKNLKLPSHRIGRACQPAGLGKSNSLFFHCTHGATTRIKIASRYFRHSTMIKGAQKKRWFVPLRRSFSRHAVTE